MALTERWRSPVYPRPRQSVRRQSCPGWSPRRAGSPCESRSSWAGGKPRAREEPPSPDTSCATSHRLPVSPTRTHPALGRAPHAAAASGAARGPSQGGSLGPISPEPPGTQPSPPAAPGVSPAPAGTGQQTPRNTFCCIWEARDADHQPYHVHILLTGFNFISHMFDNGNRFFFPHFGVSSLRSCGAGGAAGAERRRCGGPDLAGWRWEVTRTYRLGGASLADHRITEWSGLAGISVGHPAQPPAGAGSPTAGCTAPSLALLPKKVFAPCLGVGRGGRAAPRPRHGGSLRAIGSAHHSVGFSDLNPGQQTKRASVSGGCSGRYLTAQNLQEFLISSLSAQPLVQTVSARAGHTKRGRPSAVLLEQRHWEQAQRQLCLSPSLASWQLTRKIAACPRLWR